MKEWLLTSTIPYWIVFAMSIISILVCVGAKSFLRTTLMDSKPATFIAVLGVSVVLLLTTAAECGIYVALKNKALWWCISDEYGFFSKLLRSIPLFIFLFLQIGQVWMYRDFFEYAIDEEGLKVKGAVLATVVLMPVMFIVYIFLDFIGLGPSLRNTIFYVCLLAGIIIGVGKTAYSNIQVAGFIRGVFFTTVMLGIVAGAIISVILLFSIVVKLFMQLVVFVAVCCALGGTLAMVGKASPSSGSSSSSSPLNSVKPNMSNIMRDDSGQLHTSTMERDMANKRIKEKKEQGS